MSEKKEIKSMRLNIPIDSDLNDKLELQAKKMGVSKAGVVRLMINQYLMQDEALSMLSQMSDMVDKLEKLKDK